jgi:hypothetical protein
MTVWTSGVQRAVSPRVGPRLVSRRHGIAPRTAIVALVLACLTWGVARVAAPGESARPVGGDSAAAAPARSAGLQRLQALPLEGQSVISTSLGSDAPGFAAQRDAGGYRLRGGGVTAALGARGVVLSAGSASLSLFSPAIGNGDRLGPSGAGSISARGNRVAYRRGALTAWYAAGPLGIEQGFDIRARPAGSARELTVALGLSTTLRARRSASGLEFLTSSGQLALRYGGLVATDARGRRLPATLAIRGGALVLRVADAGAVYPLRIDPLIQTGSKIVPGDELAGTEGAWFGASVALSADGTTALIGGPYDNSGIGAAWVYSSTGGSWSEQARLTGTSETGDANFGTGVALSADGDTALIGGPGDTSNAGAAWVATRSGSTWSATTKLAAPTGGFAESGTSSNFGSAVALSAQGTTALIGGDGDGSHTGAAWVYTGSGASLAAADKLVGPDASSYFGWSVALSAAGTTALVGADQDNSGVGAAWIFTGSGGSWSAPTELLGGGESGDGQFGWDVALDSAGTTAIVGGPGDGFGIAGAAWVFAGSGSSWAQQAELTAPTTGPDAESGGGNFGSAVALSADGSMALIGGSFDDTCGATCAAGAAWVFNGAGSSWQENAKLIPPTSGANAEIGGSFFGTSVALSSDGTTEMIGGEGDNTCGTGCYAGAAWASTPPDGFGFGPSPVIFGSSGDGIVVGTASAEAVTVTNSGYTPRVLGTVSLSGAQSSAFSLSGDSCSGHTLTPGSSCSVTVHFSPGSPGTFAAQINVPDNAPNSPDVVSVSGFAAVAPIAAPVLRESADVAPAGGTVLVKLLGSSVFEPLSVAENVPMGSTIDATNGTAAITTALPGGTTQTGDFYDGEFVVTQAANGRVTVTLTGGSFKGCPVAHERKKHKKSQVHFAAAKKSATTVVRKLWGNAHGNYTTSARSASASVLGTIWLTEDRCDGSYFKVTKDTIAVTAFAHPKKVHHLKQGQSILIAARGF